jgi:hypothetical protein
MRGTARNRQPPAGLVHRGACRARATRVALGATVAALSVSVSVFALGCGSSSNSRGPEGPAGTSASPESFSRAVPPQAERSFEQQTSRAELAYRSQVEALCAEIHRLPRFSPHREGPQETGKEAEAEIEALERVRRHIDRLRALPFMRSDRQAYLHVLGSALLLDRRIVADGGEGSVLSAAMTQHEDNSQRRSGIAERLKIWCLVQSEPT